MFKNSSGTRYTRGLFYETTGEDKSSVLYTLKDKEHKGYRSLKELYLSSNDTTEYEFSKRFLDGYDHWLQLVNSEWFRPFALEWREELRVKLENAYIAELSRIIADGGKDRLPAIKVLLDRLRKPKEALKRGRPVLPPPEEDKIALRLLEREMSEELEKARKADEAV